MFSLIISYADKDQSDKISEKSIIIKKSVDKL